MDEPTVREIRKLHAEGVSYEELAVRYGISKPWAYRIVRRLAWANVD